MTKSEIQFRGLYTCLGYAVSDGEVDEASYIRLLHQQLDQGVEGFVINGTTGEGKALS